MGIGHIVGMIVFCVPFDRLVGTCMCRPSSVRNFDSSSNIGLRCSFCRYSSLLLFVFLIYWSESIRSRLQVLFLVPLLVEISGIESGLMSHPSLFILKTEVPIIGDSVVSFLLEYNNKDGERNFKGSGVFWQA